jgi:lipid-A-disaccharide synthase
MKYFIITGEASGDLHASNLVLELKKLDPQIQCYGFGGDLMRDAGVELSMHYRELAVMGFVDVIKNIFSITKKIAFCKSEINRIQPDALIFIDFSGFNLRIAKWAKKFNYKTHYYIAPQVWASRSKRVEKIKATIDHLYCTLPFEVEFYKKHQYEVTFVGHPLIDALALKPIKEVDEFKRAHQLPLDKELIALLPGSRKAEVTKILSSMLSVVDHFENFHFAVAMAPSLEKELYEQLIQNQNVSLVNNDTYSLLKASKAALVTSGTATLETALLKVPQIVCYKTQALTFWIAKKIIKLPYISLVNIILKKEVVPELIQSDLTLKNLKQQLELLLSDQVYDQQLKSYEELEHLLGEGGASRRAATAILKNT